MKFLCVACDDAMKLLHTRGQDDGSMAAVFACPTCGRETAMLTNAMEAQMVRALGVKIGGRSGGRSPLETVRRSLAGARGQAPAPEAKDAPDAAAESGCPFGDMVNDALSRHAEEDAIAWTPAAEARIANVPAFAQVMVRKGIEMHARENGYIEINEAVMDEVKDRFGM